MYLNENSSVANLKEFLNCHQTAVNAIKALRIKDLSDFLLFSLALRNIDPHTRRAFENQLGTSEIPEYKSFMDFVTQQLQAHEFCQQNSSKIMPKPSTSRHVNPVITKPRNMFSTNSASTSQRQIPDQSSRIPNTRKFHCPKCSDSHPLFACPQYIAMSRESKLNFLKSSKRCFNCLGLHNIKDCSSKNSCKFCSSNRHHTSLHPNCSSFDSSVTREGFNRDAQNVGENLVNSCHLNKEVASLNQVLLGTVQARIQAADGSISSIRAVLDPGSQVSAVTERLVHRLGLKINPTDVHVSGIGKSKARSLGMVTCKLYPLSSANILELQAVVLPQITNSLPSVSLSPEIIEHFEHLDLADKNFYLSRPVDMLLGADTYSMVFDRDGRLSSVGFPTAVNTFFGWTIIGPVQESKLDSAPTSILLADSILGDTLRAFRSLEEVSEAKVLNTIDEYVCLSATKEQVDCMKFEQ
ncbi:uncharacterized protein LOC123306990 [Coccinella septempunctata]|uniref:uncharacterized protein LOC123306990 n=1 Tax=Coccinella septempunctata TaxID=41139 RepID=UPI001D085AB0|nr:uncharacterized protein LOC123306990 [Coccinella septempunctata]